MATKAGRRFYEEAPQTEWIIHLPVVNVRSGQQFNERYIDLTPETLTSIYNPDRPEYALLKLNRARGDQATLDRMMNQYRAYLPPGTILDSQWEYEDLDEGARVEERRRGLVQDERRHVGGGQPRRHARGEGDDDHGVVREDLRSPLDAGRGRSARKRTQGSS